MAINIDRLKKTTIKLTTSIVKDITQAIKEKTGEDVTIYEAGDAIRNISGGATDLTTNIDIENLVMPAGKNPRINFNVQPFSLENINKDWDIVINAHPYALTSESTGVILGFTNLYSKKQVRFLEFYYSDNSLYIYFYNISKQFDEKMNRDFSDVDLKISKRGQIITVFDLDGITPLKSFDISSSGGDDYAEISLGWFQGVGSRYEFEGVINKFTFKYV